MNKKIGISNSEHCNSCLGSSNNCSCEIPDYIKSSHELTFNAYKSLYQEIAIIDQAASIQSEGNLQDKAIEDFTRIEKIKKKYFQNVHIEDFRILEIGPGLGHLGKMLSQKSYQYFAADIIPNYISEFPSNCFLANVENLPEFAMKFHLIVACDVFEHVLNEGDAILSASQSLCNEGALYIRSPYKEPSINYATKLGAPFPFIHLRTYSKKSLQNLVESGGLKTKELRLGKIVMMSHTRRNLFFRERYFEMLRTDLSNAYGNKNSINNSESRRFLYSKLKKMYEKYENEALNSHGSDAKFSWVGRKIFFRPAEIWCLAVKTRND